MPNAMREEREERGTKGDGGGWSSTAHATVLFLVMLTQGRGGGRSTRSLEASGGMKVGEHIKAHQGRRCFSGGGGGGSPATGSVFCSRILVIDNRDEKRGERDGVSLASRW